MYLVVCANCGKQTMVNGPEDTCQFCGKHASKKEVMMAETSDYVGEDTSVPARPKKRKLLRQYYEQNREAILADYKSMKLKDFFKRWGISSTGWTKLKADWNVQGKHKKHGLKKQRKFAIADEVPASPEAPEAVARSVEAPLTEHEHYLVLLGWQQAAREFLKAGKVHD